jgi:hypothetical protein
MDGRSQVGLVAVVTMLVVPYAVIFLLSRVSGWSELADRFPARGPMPRPRHWLGYAVLRGWIGYNGSLIVASDERGLHLAALPILASPSHAPVFIPWGQLKEIRRGRRLRSEVYELHIIGLAHLDFTLRPRAMSWIREDARRAGVAGDYG